MEHAETVLVTWIMPLKLVVELIGVIIIGIGCLRAVVALARRRLQPGSPFTGLRLGLASYLALGLEFQLAADIVATAISPSWDEIGKLAAIATVRTALNFALAREMKEERSELTAEAGGGGPPEPRPAAETT